MYTDLLGIGIGGVAKSSILLCADIFFTFADGDSKRMQNITAIAIDCLMIIGYSLALAGAIHGNLPMVFAGAGLGIAASLMRLIFFYAVQKEDKSALTQFETSRLSMDRLTRAAQLV